MVERRVLRAEMEVQKAANILEHRDEIMSRPKRTWFQTEDEKKAIKDATRPADEGEAQDELTALRKATDIREGAGLSRNKRRQQLWDKMTEEDWARKKCAGGEGRHAAHTGQGQEGRPEAVQEGRACEDDAREGDAMQGAQDGQLTPVQIRKTATLRPDAKKGKAKAPRKAFKSKAKHNRRK